METIDLTKSGEQEVDWQRIVDLEPKGYLELNDTKTVIHGPIESIKMNELDMVEITLKWAASTPYPGTAGPQTGWKNYTERRVFKIPNLMVPFVVEATPQKGPRVRFGFNILYINEQRGVDPRTVEGLVL